MFRPWHYSSSPLTIGLSPRNKNNKDLGPALPISGPQHKMLDQYLPWQYIEDSPINLLRDYIIDPVSALFAETVSYYKQRESKDARELRVKQRREKKEHDREAWAAKHQ